MTPLERAEQVVAETFSRFGAAQVSKEFRSALARAVLMAVREPSESMMKAGSCDYGWDNPSPSESWPAMIQAILNDGEGE